MTGFDIIGLAGGITIVVLMILLTFSLCKAASDCDDWEEDEDDSEEKCRKSSA